MTSKKESHGPRFLNELRLNGGFVHRACEAVNVSVQSVYNWREADPVFRKQWDEAVTFATEQLEAECRRRAYEGVLEPVYYKGQEVGVIRRYSDTLLIFQLKALNARYRDRLAVDVNRIDADIERELALLGSGGEAAITSEAEGEAIH